MTLSRRSLFASLAAGLVAGTSRVVAAKLPASTIHGCIVGPTVTICAGPGWERALTIAISRHAKMICFAPGVYRVSRAITLTPPTPSP